ncbi:MAG: hypothetical protein JXA73_02800 [Acidobacteria bacterium]|nr:hypothetical protein [Acidobacteriota bacterium]
MQFPKVRMCWALVLLVFSWSVWAQAVNDREAVIHKNVKLFIMAAKPDIPEDIAKQYQNFLPIFEEVLKENTTDESDACALTIRISIGIKEIGSAKTKRPMASVIAYRRGSKQEFVATFLLYSYTTSSLVNKEEIEQFLKKQILEPSKCEAT